MANQVKKEKLCSFDDDENIKCGEILFSANTRFCFSCTFCQKQCDKIKEFYHHVLFDHLNYLEDCQFSDDDEYSEAKVTGPGSEEDAVEFVDIGVKKSPKKKKKGSASVQHFDNSKEITETVTIKSEVEDEDDDGEYKDDIEEIEIFIDRDKHTPAKKRPSSSSKSKHNDMLHIEFLEEATENEYEIENTDFIEEHSIKNESQEDDDDDEDAADDIVEIELNNVNTHYSNESEDGDDEFTIGSLIESRIHTKIHEFKCPFPDCKRSFLTKNGASRHYDNFHSIDKKCVTCDLCCKTFSTQTLYEKHHMLRHLGIKPHECEICGQGFSDKSNLNVHIMRHKGIKPHGCSTCQKRFHSSTELKLHMRSHTGERPFVCELCGRKFSNSGHLCNHRRRHLGERPFECDVCQKKFFDRKLLNDHKVMHSTARPFECVTCSATFQRKKALLQHEKLHSGTKQYVCKICGKSFAQNAGLYSHMKSH